MNDRLDDRVALVTGASRGIGATIARELAAAGATVGLAGRHEETLREVARSLPDASRSCVANTTRRSSGIGLRSALR